MQKPICHDLYCGLGGWAEGFLAEDYDVTGYDIERHDYGTGGYPGRLVLRDVREIHGSELADAAAIVASPPCQKYSYMAMPWTKAKELREWYRDPQHQERIRELNELFDACFRIQREASEAAGRHIPLIVENVKGAQPWVGTARWHFGSFYLWGDVPALMPIPSRRAMKLPEGNCSPRMWSESGSAETLRCNESKRPRLEPLRKDRRSESALADGSDKKRRRFLVQRRAQHGKRQRQESRATN